MAYNRKRPPLDPCPVEAVFSIVAGKWKVRILYLLSLDTLGFSALRTAVGGIRQQVLSNALKDLEQSGVVKRIKLNADCGFEYCLSFKGEELVALLEPIAKWGNKLLFEQGVAWQRPAARLARGISAQIGSRFPDRQA